MNHAGEIRRLVELAEPDVRVWTNVGDAHLGLLRLARGDRRREGGDPRGRRADDRARRERRRPLRDGADAGVSPAASITFGTSSGADVRATRRRGAAASTARARTSRTPDGEADLRRAAARRRQPAERARGHRRRARLGVPLERDRRRVPRRCSRRAASRARSSSLRTGVTLVDDSYNSSPSALMRALDARRRAIAATRASVAVLGEMLELGAFAHALHEECGHAARRRRRRAAGRRRRRRRPHALADAADRAGSATTPRVHVATSAEAADLLLAVAARRATWCSSRARAASAPTVVVDRVKAEWALMLYHLLFSLHPHGLRAERDALHHVPHRGGEPDGARHQPAARAVADPHAARVPDRPGDPPGRTARRIAPRPARRRWAAC